MSQCVNLHGSIPIDLFFLHIQRKYCRAHCRSPAVVHKIGQKQLTQVRQYHFEALHMHSIKWSEGRIIYSVPRLVFLWTAGFLGASEQPKSDHTGARSVAVEFTPWPRTLIGVVATWTGQYLSLVYAVFGHNFWHYLNLALQPCYDFGYYLSTVYLKEKVRLQTKITFCTSKV